MTQQRKLIDLTKSNKSSSTQPKTKATGGLPHRDGPPIPTGKVVYGSNLKEQKLRELGVEDGPLPPNFAEYLAQTIQEEKHLFAEKLNDSMDPGKYSPPAIQQVDLASLPHEKKEEIRGWIERFRKDQQTEKQLNEQIKDALNPGVAEQLKANLRALQKEQSSGLFIDDVSKEKDKEPVKPQDPVAPPVLDPKVGSSGAGGLLPQDHCPRCNHDLTKPDWVEVTDEDRVAHRMALWTADRFRKTISVVDGTMQIGFRSLTNRERQIATTQTLLDQVNAVSENYALPDSRLWGNLFDYRMALSLEYIQNPHSGRTDIPTLEESGVVAPDKKNTALKVYYEGIVEQVLKTEQLARLVGAAYTEFEEVCNKLDAQTYDPKVKSDGSKK